MSYIYEYPRPAVTTDIVVFRKHNQQIQVLLIQRLNEPYKNQWALPGGFVDSDEPLINAALRELKEETNIDAITLTQMHAFGDPGRDPRGHCISIVYWGWLPENSSTPIAGDDAKTLQWFALNNLPSLAFDHREIIDMAVEKTEKEKAF